MSCVRRHAGSTRTLGRSALTRTATVLESPCDNRLTRVEEEMRNPVAQALLLNEAGTDLYLIVGLCVCVGHDIIFTQNTKAPVTTLIVKDRVLAHKPVGALTSSCWREKLGLDARGERPRPGTADQEELNTEGEP